MPKGDGIPPIPRSVLAIACVLGIALVFGGTILAGGDKVRTGADDFLAFYAGARLAGTPGIYDPDSIRRTELEAAGANGQALLSIRIPGFSLLMWPLAQLPYAAAHALWYAIRIAAVIGFVLLWPWTPRGFTALICCWSLPIAAGLANGQDAPLLLFWLAAWQWLERRGHPFAAGAVLILCAAKFHLFLLIPVLLIRHRRWAALGGAAAGGCALYLLSVRAGGWDWPVRYARVLSNPVIHPCEAIMPNLHGLLSGIAPAYVEIGVAVALALAAVAALTRLSYAEGLAVALAAGLLLSYHAYVADGVILVPAILIVLGGFGGRLYRWAAVALATPAPWLLVLSRATRNCSQ
jgi:hypothetical protein